MCYAMAMNVMYTERHKQELKEEKKASMSAYDYRHHEKEISVWQFIGLLFV